MTVLIVLGIVLGLIALPVLINLDYGGTIMNTFDFELTQSEKSKPENK